MIQGAVNADLEAVVPLTVQGTAGHAQEVEAVIDTGFSGFLTLPSVLVAELGLAFGGVGWAVLADGTEARFDVYDATLLWDGQPRRIYVYVAETAPLAGHAPPRGPRPACRGRERRTRRHRGPLRQSKSIA